jgi:uncharacterized membrane protein YcaP (DUF421 family)
MNVDWSALFSLHVPLAELLVRSSAMYWFLLLVFRCFGVSVFRCVVRRELGGIGVSDILIMVIVADASQNALSGSYRSTTDGFVLVGTLIGWNLLLNWLGFRFPF